MFCTQCGTENQETARFCQKCGASVSDMPTQKDQPIQSQSNETAIWNPNAAANWSLLFTPAFGSYLQMINWRTLGENGKAISSQNWFYISLGILVIYVLMGIFMDNPKEAESAVRGLGFLFLLVWYFSSGRAQGKYVKARFGKTYAKKPWGKPLFIGVGAIIGYFIAAVVIGILIGIAGQA
jgi:hypothetical protein